jgi:hypothetical protein
VRGRKVAPAKREEGREKISKNCGYREGFRDQGREERKEKI